MIDILRQLSEQGGIEKPQTALQRDYEKNDISLWLLLVDAFSKFSASPHELRRTGVKCAGYLRYVINNLCMEHCISAPDKKG